MEKPAALRPFTLLSLVAVLFLPPLAGGPAPVTGRNPALGGTVPQLPGDALEGVAYLPLALGDSQPLFPGPEPLPSVPTPSPTSIEPGPTPSPVSSPAPAAHFPGEDCFGCHTRFKAAGTVFTDETARSVAPGARVSLVAPDGSKTVLETNARGNIAVPMVPDGVYLTKVGDITSRTWHHIPDQGSCNSCHILGGNASEERSKQLGDYHTRIPADNLCAHCHHFPASMSLGELMAPGVLNVASAPPSPPGSQVSIAGQTYSFDSSKYEIETVRPDIFAPGYFSMFDVILAVAERNGIAIEYEYDESRKTHFITKVNNIGGDFWYHFSYDTGSSAGNRREIQYTRSYRWDEALWRPGVWVRLVEGENLAEVKRQYSEEIERENTSGHLVPLVRFSINPSPYEGNPPGSGRVTVRRDFADVHVTAHGLRSPGYPSPYSKPFQPGVVTSLDVLLSLMDQGKLDVVTSVFYSHFNDNFIDSYYVVELGFPDVGAAHASGRQGFVYTTGNGTPNRLPNNADRKFHITCDISVIHAPDFSYWHWIELGNPYYESENPTGAQDRAIEEDYDAIGRGFNLHSPHPDPSGRMVRVRYNVLEPGAVKLTVHDDLGRQVTVLYDGFAANVGVHELAWTPDALPSGTYYIKMQYEDHEQVRSVAVGD